MRRAIELAEVGSQSPSLIPSRHLPHSPPYHITSRSCGPDLSTPPSLPPRSTPPHRSSQRAQGQTFPNPCVGSCIVDANDEVVGEGFHPKAGMPHAEVYALRAAGAKARGATAYVTLEPCAHTGRTPPCARALVAAGVARVVVGAYDPNPLVGGKGISILERAGIEVEYVGGEEERHANEINAEFMARMRAEAEKGK